MTTESGISNTDNILGDPRKSLMVMVVPIAIGMLVQALNNLVDAIWVSSLGTGALAATGVVFPFFFILVGIGNGLGVGASQAIARRIGTGDRAGASAAAAQVMVIGVIVGVVMTAVFAFLAEPIFTVAGAGPYLEETLAYGIPIMLCSPIYMVSFIFSALLRSEGAAKKSMYIQVAGVAAHMVLDPILIFGLDMGITGAAVASALAMAMASLMAVRYYLSGDMYVRFSFRGFRFDRDLDRDILRVGIPASLEMVLLSLSSMLMNLILGSDAMLFCLSFAFGLTAVWWFVFSFPLLKNVRQESFVPRKKGAVAEALKGIGCDTAKSVLALPVDEIVKRADLEEETVQDVQEILRKEFEE